MVYQTLDCGVVEVPSPCFAPVVHAEAPPGAPGASAALTGAKAPATSVAAAAAMLHRKPRHRPAPTGSDGTRAVKFCLMPFSSRVGTRPFSRQCPEGWRHPPCATRQPSYLGRKAHP